jgi:hypothetical protein
MLVSILQNFLRKYVFLMMKIFVGIFLSSPNDLAGAGAVAKTSKLWQISGGHFITFFV